MSLQEVVTEVQRDGQARAKEVVAAAQKEAESLLQAAREKASAQERSRLAEAQRDAQQLLLQARSRATSESRKIVLQAEAELRTRLRDSVLESFAHLPAATRAQHIQKLLQRAHAIVPEGTVYSAPADAQTLQASDYSFGGETGILGGVVVESKDGTSRLDLSYETLLAGMWRDVLRSEAKLFA